MNYGIIINDDPLAQLEERYLHTVEVAGSSPVGITILVKEYCVSQITDPIAWVRYLFAGSADARGLFMRCMAENNERDRPGQKDIMHMK